MTIAYWLFWVSAIIGVPYLLLLAIWGISKNERGLFFTNLKEGTGTFRMDGEKAGEIILAMRGHACEVVKETRPIYDQEGKKVGEKVLRREKIIEQEPRYSPGILGYLEKKYGIYWMGLPPKSRMRKEFKWQEWDVQKGDDGKTVKNEDGTPAMYLNPRKEITNFFFVQTFPYGIVLRGAETGGTKKEDGSEIGGNIPVDVEIDLFVRIVYPRIALFDNEDWFGQLGSTVLDHARRYVGTHPYEKLRSLASPRGSAFAHNDFSEDVMKLNNFASIGKVYDGVPDALGVMIYGAQIRTVTLSKVSDSPLAKATTDVYVAQQEKEAAKLRADAEAYEIKEVGGARNKVLKDRIEAAASQGDIGKLVLNAEAITDAAKTGSTIIANGGTPFILNTGTNKGG